MRYRIAYFTVDWNYELVESTMRSMKRFVDEHEDIQLCVFDCFGKDVDTPKTRSEYAIFQLPDLKRFSGVIVQGSQVVLEAAREELARRIREAGVPAVTMDCPIEGCTLVQIDNRQAQYDIAAHVIREHGARRLAYMTGIMDNGCPEAALRLAGFQDACRDAGIDPAQCTVIRGTWRTDDGTRTAREWLASGRPLPDAFVCANDEMALGLMQEMERQGRHIPEDVIIVGFDNVASAELSSPRLSTVWRDNAAVNRQALDLLLEMIDGKRKEDLTLRHDIICSESCGCAEKEPPDSIRRRYFHQTRFLKDFYTFQDRLAEQLFEAVDLPELMGIVEKNRQIFGCENVYLCINDYYFDNYDKTQWHHDSETFGEEMVLACGWERGRDGREPRFPVEELLPAELMEKERFLVFYPLHYNTYSIGYLAMNGISEAAKMNLQESILNFLEIGIENVRKKCLLRQMNDVLDDLYVRDPLTGAYNRFGYKRFGAQIFMAFMVEEGGAQVLFIDMDDMKHINDRFGHDRGDEAIRAAAGILRDACGRRDFIMRYGGDEFLVIASTREGDLKSRILEAADEFNRGVPYSLQLSIGIVRPVRGDNLSLDEWVKIADAQMYETKKRRKAAAGRNEE